MKALILLPGKAPEDGAARIVEPSGYGLAAELFTNEAARGLSRSRRF